MSGLGRGPQENDARPNEQEAWVRGEELSAASRAIAREFADEGVRQRLEAHGVDAEEARLELKTDTVLKATAPEREAFAQAAGTWFQQEARKRRIRRAFAWVVAPGLLVATGATIVGLDSAARDSPVASAGILIGSVMLVGWVGAFVVAIVMDRTQRRRLRSATDELRDARERFDRAMTEGSVRAEIRTTLNEARLQARVRTSPSPPGAAGASPPGPNPEYPRLRPIRSDGLSELSSGSWTVPTQAIEDARMLLDEMPKGTIGISGPRGVGKTTLLTALSRENQKEAAVVNGPKGTTRPPGRSVTLTAPVIYQPQEFARELFVAVCNTVIHGRESAPPPPDSVTRSAWSLWRTTPITRPLRQALAVLGLGVTMMVTSLFLSGVLRPFEFSITPSTILFVVVFVIGYFTAVTAIGAGGVAIARGYRERQAIESQADVDLRDAAQQHLRDLRFQHKSARASKGAWTIPQIGPTLERSSANELTRREPSHLELVFLLRGFLEHIASHLQRKAPDARGAARPRVVIAIDELDKIGAPADAQHFLNELKALFDIPDCFWLISISEEAMASFETRGLPFRDVFDSTLDEVVTLRPLTMAESQALLFRQLVLERPFIALVHCISGGVPRDLVRTARVLVLLSYSDVADGDGIPVSQVAEHIVQRELRSKGEALSVAISAAKPPRSTDRLRALAEAIRTARADAGVLETLGTEASAQDLLDEVPIDATGSWAQIARLARELDGFLAFLACVLRLFEDGLTEERLDWMEEASDGKAGVERLAMARQAFGSGSGLGIQFVREWEKAQDALPPWDADEC